MSQLPRKVYRFAASYELSCALFALLFLLTFLGTLYQVKNGLYPAREKYFESFFLVHRAFGLVPTPLPGAQLVLVVLFVNLLAGGIVRARKGWSRAGILTAHAGILILLAGAFVSHRLSASGHLTLYENESADAFESYDEWEIGVSEASVAGPVTEYIIRERDFAGRGNGSRTFRFGGLPFELTLSGYAPDAVLGPASPYAEGADPSAGDRLLEPIAPRPERERRRPGVYARAIDAGGSAQEGVLWAGARGPWTFPAGGRQWAVSLRKRRWPLSFTIRLDKFTRELHPGTSMPRAFTSDVTRIENGVSQQARISMNAPLRHEGYTFYQSSWGPPDAGPGDPLYSTLAVVRNPVEQVPLYACVVITAGLLLHFIQKLFRYLRAESLKARSAAA